MNTPTYSQHNKCCPTCGSDCNERYELEKAEREIERLTALSLQVEDEPMQPIVVDKYGTVRFRKNELVDSLLEVACRYGYDLNWLAMLSASAADRMQFAQLIGYSVSGYGSLSYVSDASYTRVQAALKEIQK